MSMIKGVGVDLVDIDELARLLDAMGDRVFSHIFTVEEMADAPNLNVNITTPDGQDFVKMI